MMRRFNSLVFFPWLSAALFFAHADPTEPDTGHIGSAFARAKDSDFLTIEYVAANSPAAEAGIKKDDCIVAINGISTRGMSLAEARHDIDGDIGGVVKLTIHREGATEEGISVVRRSLLDTFLPAATGGDSRAQFYVGHFYEHGPTTIRDLAKAAEWYHKAAEQGFPEAQAFLGYMYRYGWGIPKDQEAAADWLLKGAGHGDFFAERELALGYLNGEGLRQSDQDAFDWFYSAAQQDDSTAEEYLGFLYRKGRGVKRDDQAAFDWYYRSAERDNAYGEWELAYMYEKGLGVTPNVGEALKWYQKAQVGFPQNENLRKNIAAASLRAFLESPSSTSLDPSLIMSTFGRRTWLLFIFLALAYVAGGIVLFYFSLKAPDAPPKLSVAIGWVMFYVESQGVALLAIFIFWKLLTAGILIVVTSIFSALPVIASSCGPHRNRIWKPSQVSWKTLLLYGVCSCLAFFLIGLVYAKIYTLITHSSLPLQPTQVLISKAKHASAWLTYATIALALPITEEIIFRSYLFDALKRRFSGKIVVIITALAFSLVHFQSLYFVPLLGVGLILGWVRLKTDSLRLPILLHAINNGLSLAFAV